MTNQATLPALAPLLAAQGANAIYEIKDELNVANALAKMPLIASFFDFTQENRITGRSGGLVVYADTGFGLIGVGKDQFAGHIVILLRGTKSLGDFITDCNIGLRVAPGGSGAVHTGFDRAFRSLLPGLMQRLQEVQFQQVHVIGHSLGGALATLVADHIKRTLTKQVVLYTFGAPRVGSQRYTQAVTNRLGMGNIRRVYHNNDPVSMVPVWPFYPLPFGNPGFYIPYGFTFNALAPHSMDKSYIPSITTRNIQNWQQFSQIPNPRNTEADIKAWLNSEGSVEFGARSVQLVWDSLIWLLKQAGISIYSMVQNAFLIGVTVIDSVAFWLHQQLGTQHGDFVLGAERFIKRLLVMMGRGVQQAANWSYLTIRNLLNEFVMLLNRIAKAAVDAIFG